MGVLAGWSMHMYIGHGTGPPLALLNRACRGLVIRHSVCSLLIMLPSFRLHAIQDWSCLSNVCLAVEC